MVMAHVDLASATDRMVEATTLGALAKPKYPPALMALNPWGYWQLNDVAGSGSAADTASPTNIGCGGSSWSQFPFPPPHALTYGASVVKVPGLLIDYRTALNNPSGGSSGQGASIAYSEYVDAPWWEPTNGTWFHYVFERVKTPVVNNRCFYLTCAFGDVTFNVDWIATGNVGLIVHNNGSGGDPTFNWANCSGPALNTKWHNIMNVQGNASSVSATLWCNGVNQGTQSASGYSLLSTGYLTEGITIAEADGLTFQDMAIGGADNAGCAMTDARALSLYTLWQSEL